MQYYLIIIVIILYRYRVIIIITAIMRLIVIIIFIIINPCFSRSLISFCCNFCKQVARSIVIQKFCDIEVKCLRRGHSDSSLSPLLSSAGLFIQDLNATSGGLASASSMKLSGEIARTSSSLINAQFSQPSIPCFFFHEEISLKICVGRRGKGMPDPSSAQLRSCMNLSRTFAFVDFPFFLFSRQSDELVRRDVNAGKYPVILYKLSIKTGIILKCRRHEFTYQIKLY